MRYFEKISENQFKKDVSLNMNLYLDLEIPRRGTKDSAGYDFYLIDNIVIKPNEIVKVPTGIKACMNNGEVLLMVMRSSLGFKYNLRLTNQVGVIDKDYYNNPSNEGHIHISIQNEGDKEIILNKGDRIAQGLFINYLLTDNEKENNIERMGGFGSTNGEL